jgi:DNA replication and repair protein RecF
MRLTHLSLTNFRNYARLELDLPGAATLLVGDNAQGKSNLLEAIGLLAVSRSFRASSDRELIHWLAMGEPQPYARVVGLVQKASGELRAEIVLATSAAGAVVAAGKGENGDDPDAGQPALAGEPQPGLSKRLRLNGVPKRAADYVGQVNVVSFSPPDLELVTGSPGQRRRYLDVLLAQIDSRYYRALARYNRVLAQRNHLLRSIAARHEDPAELAFWDDEMVTHGSYLTAARQAAVSELNGRAAEIHLRLTGGRERLHVIYRPSVPPGDSPATDRFRHELKRLHRREVLQGVSLAGPHRDDLAFVADGADMRAFGSRGQQRTAALSLKMAEVGAVSAAAGELPVLLLDDIMSELDPSRRAWLLENLNPAQQVLIAATETEHFTADFLASALVLRVQAGAVTRLSGAAVES